MTKTVYVLPSDQGWTVKKEGKPGRLFTTKKDAVSAARKAVRAAASGQYVVFDKDGRITSRVAVGLPKILPPYRKSSLGTKRIEEVVSKVIFARLISES
ncbi:MAG TPA: DUF2188 domain-containing protein [Bryobacteraceae bacterium]|nr:DUF2188 domain-containing protein [Bryobacteraceae bacterium]